MKDEAWLKKIREQMENYSEPLPPLGWERLERELPRHKPISLYQWASAAAALLAGALWLIGVHLADSPVNPDIPMQTTVSVMADALPALPQTETRLPSTLQTERPIHTPLASPSTTTEDIIPTLPTVIKEEVKKEKSIAASDKENTSYSASDKRKKTELPSANQSLLAVTDQPHKKSKGWSVGFSIGNSGGFSNLSGNEITRPFQQNAPGTSYLNLDLSTTSNQVIGIPQNQELIFKNGLPYLQNRTRQIVSAQHKQPISAGFSIRKNLPKGFSIETGVVYTYLASDILYEGSTETLSQKMHYLGIPLRANWNFVDKRRFTLYVAAGGTIEKCVYGKIGHETATIDPIQLSVLAAIGAQYNLGKHVGIYVEPGVSYFFDDGSDILTIRKDNPCNFTLQAGLRLSY